MKCFLNLLIEHSVHRSDTDAVTTTEAPPVSEKKTYEMCVTSGK